MIDSLLLVIPGALTFEVNKSMQYLFWSGRSIDICMHSNSMMKIK